MEKRKAAQNTFIPYGSPWNRLEREREVLAQFGTRSSDEERRGVFDYTGS